MRAYRLISITRISLTALLLLTLSSNIHAKVITFTLDHVLNTAAESMTGSFDWTYNEGDFENGSGLFTELNIPRYGTDISGLVITIDLSSIEFTLAGNFHSQEVDINLRLLSPLSINQPSSIDTSKDGTNYASKFSVYGFGTLPLQGHGFISGSISAASAVPNPNAIWLLTSGLALVGFITRQKNRHHQH